MSGGDPEEIKQILQKVQEVSNKYPHMRFCQIIMTALDFEGDPYYASDNILLKRMDEYIEKLNRGK